MAVCAWAQYNPESDFTVARSSDSRSITITGYTGTRQSVNIPPTIQGLSVIAIDYSAFSEKQLTSVTIMRCIYQKMVRMNCYFIKEGV